MENKWSAPEISGEDDGQCDADREVARWLENRRYQTVLRATHTIAFEYNIETKNQYVSSAIHEVLAGNYDGRMLSNVMLEDGVIHPEDVANALQFREQVKRGEVGEMTLRLKTVSGGYKWYRMSLVVCEDDPRVYVGVLADVDEEKRQRDLLRYRAEFDPISGIFNKETFFQKTQSLLEEIQGKETYLLRFDIDRFKLINQMYTISEGDRVLCYVGQALREMSRNGETYARMGNDVFSICLIRSRAEVLDFIAELERRLSEYPITFQFIMSIGVLHIKAYHGEPVNILCDRAAMAQRKVKGNYMQRVSFYEKAMSDELNREHYITGCMRKALGDQEFTIYLQPKFDMRTSRVIGAEALARWNHDGEMIPPGDFIPLFERNGFILPLDEYIWDLTCRKMRDWLDRGLEIVPISLNVSRIHLYDPYFCEKILELSEKYQIPPSLLELEITESAYTESPQILYGIMDRLQEHGFAFSMDDFGSGYSSLNALKDIPVDIIKIDLNFLREARRGTEAGRTVLEGTVRLVHSMGLPIIAEGVETRDQADFLLSIGCTRAQGFYYSRPLPCEQFEKLLAQSGADN